MMAEGQYLTGLPVGIRIGEDGAVTFTIYAEDYAEALDEDGATPDHVAAVAAALTAGTAIDVTLTAPEETPA